MGQEETKIYTVKFTYGSLRPDIHSRFFLTKALCNKEGQRSAEGIQGRRSSPLTGRYMAANGSKGFECICGAGVCKINLSRTSSNSNRKFITCPKRDGCGLWQWEDEVKMCRCGLGICKLLTSHTKENLNKIFYCCPRLVNVKDKGCGYFEWFEEQSFCPHEGKRGNTDEGKALAELRTFCEMKRDITSEVCESILEKLKSLGIEE